MRFSNSFDTLRLQGKWTFLRENEEIVHSGLITKKGKVVNSKRLIVLTEQRLVIADSSSFKLKCNFSWDNPNLRITLKNTKMFVIDSGDRTQYFIEPNGDVEKWVELINQTKSKKRGQSI